MLRPALLALGLALTAPGLAFAQTDTPAPAATPEAPAERQMRERRERTADEATERRIQEMKWDELSPHQKRRVQASLAGEGNPPINAEDAKTRWDAMDERARRSANRSRDRQAGESGEMRSRESRTERTERMQ